MKTLMKIEKKNGFCMPQETRFSVFNQYFKNEKKLCNFSIHFLQSYYI